MRRWLEEHPADAAMAAALDSATRQLRPDPAIDVEAALRSVKTRMHAKVPTRAPRQWGRYLGASEAIGAAAAILLIAGITLWRSRETTRPAHEVATASYSTVVGQRLTVRLDDGSEVILGPASRIVARGRDVTLEGEAFFRVVHNAAQPFTVRSGNAVIRDVGTEFSVHEDAAARVRVVVREGAVAVSSARDSLLLSRGDVGVLENGRLAAQRGAATPEDLAWTIGTLAFRDAPFDDVAADLKRWYGVEVRVSDTALLRRHFTGSFTNEPANRVFDVLALALGARAERRGDTIYFRGPSSSR